MGYPKTQTKTAKTRVGGQTAERRETRVGLVQCLVVSQSQQRGEQFERAAVAEGWYATVCRDAQSASMAAARFCFRLAIIDLESLSPGCAGAHGMRRLAESLAAERKGLLVLCGRDGDVLEEIWAHQVGSWLYLPGVDETSDLTMVCSEARSVVEKLFPQTVQRSSSGAVGGCEYLASDG